MVQAISVLALAATQIFGGAVAKPADDAQHVLSDHQGNSAKDVYAVNDE
jgi:hypothetical protein